jgi:hypothetical protein
MSKISTLGPIQDTVTQQAIANAKPVRALKTQTAVNAAPSAVADDATSSSYQTQLTRLSSILNGLQLGATQIRSQYLNAASQVKAGTYQLDPLQISRSIVSDLLGPSNQN